MHSAHTSSQVKQDVLTEKWCLNSLLPIQPPLLYSSPFALKIRSWHILWCRQWGKEKNLNWTVLYTDPSYKDKFCNMICREEHFMLVSTQTNTAFYLKNHSFTRHINIPGKCSYLCTFSPDHNKCIFDKGSLKIQICNSSKILSLCREFSNNLFDTNR